MTTAYSSLMGLALPVQGELSGTWGDTVNKGITDYVDIALAGTQTISGSQTAVTLSLTNGDASATNIAQAGSGATGTAQFAIINCTGNPAGLLTVTVPASSRQYVVINATSTSQSVKIVGAGPTTGVTIVSGERAHIAWNGSDFVKVASSLVSQLSGTLGVANGGTGQSSLTANNVILGNGTSAVQAVAPGANGNVLTSNGTTWTSAALPAGGLTYIFTTTGVTATDKQGVLTDTSGGSFTVTLPATPSTGAQVVVADAGASWGTNNLTVGRNGSTIGGLAENLVCDITGASVQFVYDGTTWEVYAQIGGNGGTAVTLDGVQTLTNKTISGASNTLTVDGTNEVGFRIIPQNSQSGAYTAVLADSGKQIFHPSADTTARTFTIPANSSVPYPIGTALTFINQNGAGVVTISITSDTMRLAGAGTTGNRTLAANGIATAIKLTSTEWIISGTGLT